MIRRAFCRFSGPLFFTLAVASLLLPGTVSYAQSTAKKVVKTEDDLPRFNYAIPGTATELLTSDDSFKLPNVLAVGAVDQAGDEASFTSYGDTVLVDADGYQVESVLPGGAKVRFSGTSMASPNVVNLAAKLLALDPKLTPEETIHMIVSGATPSTDGRRHNIDPKRSVELLHQQMQSGM